MNIYYNFSSISAIKNPVLTIGTFDGVHIGHKKIIDQLNEEASKIGGESVLFTFFPHPRMVIFPESHGLKLIQTQEEKLEKLKEMGLQNVIVFPFTFEFSRLTALEFVRDMLVNQLHVKKLVIGYDHQFGKNREGSIHFLRDVAETYEFEVIEIPAQDIDAVHVSSTKIREALFSGDIEKANDYLGAPFQLSGTVVKGKQLGRTIGFPTANIQLANDLKLIPQNGVYAVKVFYQNKCLKGMMNIGVRPTIEGKNDPTIEVHIFDFDQTIYGESLRIELFKKTRDEQKFNGIEALKNQLKLDEISIRTFFNRP
ncbi:MAG: bifunctional riboflavin kinase/FAD synthetase [Crocinitomicaceae bacterium]|nr:bifunctional riboflavin kinase/FAD synthetase [Crocinitomicaceae bacterium]